MHRIIGRACLVVIVGCGTAPATKPVVVKQAPVAPPVLVAPAHRLPRTFEPTGYRARISVTPDELEGSIEITGKLIEPTRVIWLHGDKLTIAKASARSGSRTITLAATPPRPDTFVALYAEEPLPAGTWTLALDYTGKVDNKGVIEPDRQPARPDATFGVFSEQLDERRYWFTNSEPTFRDS